jgi:hypothetical protein
MRFYSHFLTLETAITINKLTLAIDIFEKLKDKKVAKIAIEAWKLKLQTPLLLFILLIILTISIILILVTLLVPVRRPATLAPLPPAAILEPLVPAAESLTLPLLVLCLY